MSWWLAGASMVATTFAADTPLVVTGLVFDHGVAGNWLWWNMLMSGMLTVFFFARLWRRAGVMTDVEFAELRYSGKPAAALRGFRAALSRHPDQPDHPRLGDEGDDQDPHDLARASPGERARHERVGRGDRRRHLLRHHRRVLGRRRMWAVLWTDLVQFVIKMSAVIILAVYAVRAVGGMDKLKAGLAAHYGSADAALSVLPVQLTSSGIAATPGCRSSRSACSCRCSGGRRGIRARSRAAAATSRSASSPSKTERDGVLATLFFQVAHYAIRPWPWIVTGLAAVLLYPAGIGPTHDHEAAYVQAFVDLLPTPWRGFMMAGFAAAYMSTVGTQLNWGASYLVNDFYRRFLNKTAIGEALRDGLALGHGDPLPRSRSS